MLVRRLFSIVFTSLLIGSACPASIHADDRVELLEATSTMQLPIGRQKLLRSSAKIRRTAVVDPSVCGLIQFSPGEMALLGRSPGKTQVTVWFDDASLAPQTWVVDVR